MDARDRARRIRRLSVVRWLESDTYRVHRIGMDDRKYVEYADKSALAKRLHSLLARWLRRRWSVYAKNLDQAIRGLEKVERARQAATKTR